MSVDVGSAVGYLDLDITGFLANLKTAQSEADRQSKSIATKIGNNIKGLGSNLSKVGTFLTAGITTPLAGAGAAAFKFSTEFEKSMAQVSTIADPTKKSIESIKDEIVDLSNKTGMAASDLAEATYQAISASVDTADAVGFVQEASKLATAGFTSTTTAVDTLTTIINAYGLSAEDAAHISDVLISTQNKGKTTVDELGQSMGKIIPTANAMNVSLEDLGTAYSYLTAGGIATAETTTYLNGMFNELGKSGTTVSDILKEKTGKSFQELKKDGVSLRDVLEILKVYAEDAGVGFNDLWSSQEAGKAALALLNTSTEEYNATLKDFLTTQNDTNDAFEKMSNTTEYKMNVAIQRGKNILIDIGDTIKGMLLPYIEKGIVKLEEVSNWLSSLSEEEKQQIVEIAGIVAAIGPMLILFGKVVTGVGSLVTSVGAISGAFSKAAVGLKGFAVSLKNIGEGFTLAKAGLPALGAEASKLGATLAGVTAPMVAIIALVGALVAAFATLWKTNEGFRDSITQIWTEIYNNIKGFADGVVQRVNQLGFDFKSATDILKAVWKEFCDFVAPIFIGVFQQISDTLGFVLDAMLAHADLFIALFNGDWEKAWESAKELFKLAWDFIVDTFSNIGDMLIGIVDEICSWFGTSWEEMLNNIKQFFIDTWNGILQFFINIGVSITNSVSNFVNSIVSFFQNLPYNIGYILGYLLTVIIEWGLQLWQNAITIGTNFVTTIVTFFAELPTNIANFLTMVMETVTTWATQMPAKAREAASNFLNNVILFITRLPSTVKNFLDQTIQRLATWVTQMGQKGKEAIEDLEKNVKETAKDLPEKVMEIGEGIVQGVWNGIKAAAGWFQSQVNSFFSGIVAGAKRALGIGSPSKVFKNEIGKWLPPGIVVGFKEAFPAAMRTMQKLITTGVGAIKIPDILANVTDSLSSLRQYGNIVVGSDGTLGYVGYGGYTQSGRSRGSQDGGGGSNDEGRGGDTYNFYSPEPLNEIEAANQMKQAKKDLAEGF